MEWINLKESKPRESTYYPVFSEWLNGKGEYRCSRSMKYYNRELDRWTPREKSDYPCRNITHYFPIPPDPAPSIVRSEKAKEDMHPLEMKNEPIKGWWMR